MIVHVLNVMELLTARCTRAWHECKDVNGVGLWTQAPDSDDDEAWVLWVLQLATTILIAEKEG